MVDISDDTKRVRGRVEIRSGIVRRRRWTDEEKGQIVAQALSPDAVIADVARRYDLAPQHLSNWIRAAKQGRLVLPMEALVARPALDEPVFVPAIADAVLSDKTAEAHAKPIEIMIGPFIVRVHKDADARTLEAVVGACKRVAA